MNRIWGRARMLMAAGLFAGALAPACAENDQSIFIRGALAPSANRQNGVCTYTADPAQPQLFEGSLDVGVRDNYFAVLLVGNQLSARGSQQAVRAESNRVHINGAVVRVTNPDGSVINEFTSLSTGFADAQGNDQPAYGAIGVVAIDAKTKDALAGQLTARTQTKLVLANISVFGKTLGGVDVESGEYQLPIRVCNGCLVTFTDSNDAAAAVQPNCLKPLGTAGTNLPCSAGQDEAVPCQLCQGRPVCDPATL